jgi:hypothetical protein
MADIGVCLEETGRSNKQIAIKQISMLRLVLVIHLPDLTQTHQCGPRTASFYSEM